MLGRISFDVDARLQSLLAVVARMQQIPLEMNAERTNVFFNVFLVGSKGNRTVFIYCRLSIIASGATSLNQTPSSDVSIAKALLYLVAVPTIEILFSHYDSGSGVERRIILLQQCYCEKSIQILN